MASAMATAAAFRVFINPPNRNRRVPVSVSGFHFSLSNWPLSPNRWRASMTSTAMKMPDAMDRIITRRLARGPKTSVRADDGMLTGRARSPLERRPALDDADEVSGRQCQDQVGDEGPAEHSQGL